MKTRVGMEFHIDYAHKLPGHPRCGFDHGHTAKVVVEIEGELSRGGNYQGHMIMDFKDMEKQVEATLAQLDHRNLNDVFHFPSAENICQWIFDQLSQKLTVARVTFFEGEGKWCTVER